MYSLNNKVVLEAYVDRGLEKTVTNAFAMVQAKVKTIGLKVLVDANLSDGSTILKGSIAHLPEKFVKLSPLAKEVLESDKIEGKFFIIDISNISFVEAAENA